MRQQLQEAVRRLLKAYRRSRIWQGVVRCMAGVVVFCTTYALILPALTLETAHNCDLEEHKHTAQCYVKEEPDAFLCPYVTHSHVQDCYDGQGSLLCGIPEYVLHAHGDICCNTQGELICTLSEIEPHVHTESCYTPAETASTESVPPESLPEETILVSEGHAHGEACFAAERGALICLLSEEDYHLHGDACYSIGTEPVCGLEETEGHIHGQDCVEVTEELVCQIAESESHAHGADCSDEAGTLICQIPEREGHTHGEGCTVVTETLVCQTGESQGHAHSESCFGKNLTCMLEEKPQHLHTDECYELNTVQICELEESGPVYETVPEATEAAEPVLVCTVGDEPRHEHSETCLESESTLTCRLEEGEEHTHGEFCYGGWQLVCELEEHTHGLICKTDPTADLETAAQWESAFAHVELTDNWAQNVLLIAETQLGYRESERNYAVWPDNTVHGYTRYGDWYGMAHADWCGMFVSFCMHYAGVEEVPLNFGVRPWIEELSSEEYDLYRLAEEYTPNPGDIVFFDWEDDGLSDHVGIVYELIEATEEEPAKLKTIEGNSANRVQYVTYELEDDCLLGYGDMAAAQERYKLRHLVTQTAQTENYIVTVSYSDQLTLPEGTQLQMTEYAKDSDIFRRRCEEAGYELDWLLNIGFFLDGEELKLDGEFDVVVTNKQGTEMGESVIHFADDGAQRIEAEDSTAEAEEGQSSVSFSSDGFSDFGGIATLAETADATEFLITFVDSEDTVGWKIAKYEHFGADTNGVNYTYTETQGEYEGATGVLHGNIKSNGSNTQIRFELDGGSYTIQPGDVAIVRLKMTNVIGNLGKMRPCVGVHEQTTEGIKEINYEFDLDTSGMYVTYTMDLTRLAGQKFHFFTVQWRYPTSGATGTYYIDYIRIGQPVVEEHEHVWIASIGNKFTCADQGESVTYTCSGCSETMTIDPTELSNTIKNYAGKLLASNKNNLESASFTWDTQGKSEHWLYYNGVMTDAFMKVGTDEMHDFVVEFYENALNDNGTPKTYGTKEVDSVPPALALFDLLGSGDNAQDLQYTRAIKYVYDELEKQEVLTNYGGNYRHKETWVDYPFGLDGIYMANTFLMEYANALADGRLTNSTVTADQIYKDVYNRLKWVATTMYDESTGLYHHGWNGSKGNGVFWGRGIGWYAVALVDIIDMMPQGAYKTELSGYLPKLFDGMLKYQDPKTGMWYNLVNYDDTLTDESGNPLDNRLETSVSSMMAYAMMKAYNENFVTDAKYYGAGLRALNGIVEEKYKDGEIIDTYKQSSVFSVENIASYFSHPYTDDEAKGVGALIMAAAPDHNWSAWTVSEAQAAAAETTTAQITETRRCETCGTTQTRTVTAAETAKTIIGWNLTVVDPTKLQDGETYAVYANPLDESGNRVADNYVFLLSDEKPSADRVITTVWKDGGYGDAPITADGAWFVPVSELGSDSAAFKWKVETSMPLKDDGTPYDGNLLLQAQGCYDQENNESVYLVVREEGYRNVNTERKTHRPNYVSLTVSSIDSTQATAECKIVNENEDNYYLVLVTDGGDDWKVSSETDTGKTDKNSNVLTSIPATPVVFAQVDPVYEKTPDTSARYQLTTVDPTQLTENTNYVIYTKTGDDDYTFLFAQKKGGPAVTVPNTGFYINPTQVNGEWSLTVDQMGTGDMNQFTYKVERKDNNVKWLAAQGFGVGDEDGWAGPEYLCLRYENQAVDSFYNQGVNEGIQLNINSLNDGTAACNIVRSDGEKYELYYDGTNWIAQSATGEATTVYFAAVTDTQVPEEPEEEVYDLKVLGTTGPVVGKKYVIYYPYLGGDTGTNDVKFLGSEVNPGKGNYSRGADDVEDSMTSLITAEAEWTLESSKMGTEYTLEDIQWTVVEIDGDLCLQSVADPTLHLKLVCTSTEGVSQVNSTAYDAQGAQYFSLNFTSSGSEADSWYTVTTENGATNLGLYMNGNMWKAIVKDYTPEDEKEENIFQIYFAEVDDDSTEEDTQTPETDTVQRVGSFNFTTLDPNDLTNGLKVAIYLQDTAGEDDYTFLFANGDKPPAVSAVDTGYIDPPVNINRTWNVTAQNMGTRSMADFTWEVVIEGDIIWLKSITKNQYLRLYRNETAVDYFGDSGNEHVQLAVDTVTGEAGCQLKQEGTNYYLFFEEETGIWRKSNTDKTTIYFASVSEQPEDVPVGTNFPDGVYTGEPTVDTLRFYNFADIGEEHITALADCKFVIKGAGEGNSTYTYTIISGDNPELHLPADIPDGTYTIEEVSAADGYLRDVNPIREFTISNGKFAQVTEGDTTRTLNIGTFLNHKESLTGADKLAQVEDYNNRTYQIMLSANSDLRLYEMNPVDVIFVVDQSNSMLFPAGLEDTNLDVTLYKNNGVTTLDEKATENINQLNDLQLDEDTVYYIIADESATSTVYAIWHNGVTWMYQDASYYAKAKHENAPGYMQADGEYAILPIDAALSEQRTSGDVKYIASYDAGGNPVYATKENASLKANGGGLGYEIGGTLGKDITAATAEHETTTDAEGNEITIEKKTYSIYTATNEYNRLHYLQDALAHAIYQLADANPKNTVTLIEFRRVTQHSLCQGPMELSATNVEKLIQAVGNIKTGGGTRQDVALEHVYRHLKGGEITNVDYEGNEINKETLPDNYTKDPRYTFTVLITDGAPAFSGDDGKKFQMGDAFATTDGTDGTVYDRIRGYAKLVKNESILMTIGLGMGSVDGGGTVLQRIATGYEKDGQDNIYHEMLENAETLMDTLKQLLFSSMAPREKIDLMGDITDVISDSFYPIAWVPKGNAPSNRQLLTMKDPQDTEKDWILLEAGDWITVEGGFAGTDTSPGDDAFGQLTQETNGDFRITWDNQVLYDCGLVWVPTRAEVPNDGRALVLAEDNLGTLTDANGNATDVGRYWFYLKPGEYVYAHGEYAGTSATGSKSGTVGYSFLRDPDREYEVAGQYAQGENRAHIQWNDYYNVDFDTNFQPYLWYGKFYVKAKEDFIGGNAIDTNKLAQITVEENDGDGIEEILGAVSLDTPTVNVRLLDMDQHSSEVTVFLGDLINEAGNSPLDSLKKFYENTKFTKLISDDGDVLNAVDTADGLLTDVFYLRYAMGGDLTAAEWEQLLAGNEVKVEYTYDNASSDGPVGYFSFRLAKSGISGANPGFGVHEAEAACRSGETHATAEWYHLYVTYTAYGLDETSQDGTSARPAENANNSSGGPGTEVGDENATGLENGLGVVEKVNVHEVHVISGAIQITKEITSNLVSAEDQTYTFTVHRTEDGEDTSGDQTLTVTVPKNETTGTAALSNLERGTYVVTEADSTVYRLKEITVLSNTNCASTPAIGGTGTEVTFSIGKDPSGQNVISRADGAQYTGYTGAPNGVLGAARFTNEKIEYTADIPVTKLWSEGSAKTDVYVVLYRDGAPVLDGEGRARILLLNAGNGWKGSFTVSLAGSGDSLSNYSYSVREVGEVTEESRNWQSAVLESTRLDQDPTVLYYADPVEDGGLVGLDGHGFVVNYSGDAANGLTVRNTPAYELPEAGGPGKNLYILGGNLLISLAVILFLMYNRKTRREATASCPETTFADPIGSSALPDTGTAGMKKYTMGGSLLQTAAELLLYYHSKRRKEESDSS